MGTQTHLADFEVIKPALHQLKKEFLSSIEICLIGITANASSEKWYKTIAPPQNVGSSYPAFVNWITTGQFFDIGITPLVDNQFNRCKSAIKFFDYSALGMATVASDIGVYTPIRHGNNGLLVENTEHAWYEALKMVVIDAALRNRLQIAAQRDVFDLHSNESVYGVRTNLLKALLSVPKSGGPPASELPGQSQPAELV